jgi:SAM-dependent methyltransferase
MVDWSEVTTSYRSPDRANYPELLGYTRDEIYEDCLGGGALYLAARIARNLRVNPGDIVLDLGCGKGTTSIFLARHLAVRVIALDLWTDATFLHRKFSVRGFRDRIVPLQLDVTARLPFADEYFDALDPADVQVSIQQIEYGRSHRPAKTLLALTAVKP